jgi:hypothetical protein
MKKLLIMAVVYLAPVSVALFVLSPDHNWNSWMGASDFGIAVAELMRSDGRGASHRKASVGGAARTAATGCHRPYSDDSPWNTKIGQNPKYHPNSANLITALEGHFGSNPNTYTYPVYEVTSDTALKTVRFSGFFSNVVDNGTQLERKRGGGLVQVPIPNGAKPSRGSDEQIIIINTDTGDEWGFWNAKPNRDGTWTAVNGYHYNVKWSGVPPKGFMSRGARVTYLAGLIRKCEIERGYIDHAIAFAYDKPCSRKTCAAQGFPYYVYPATGSDGKGNYRYDFPEGTRLQLDPNATEKDIRRWCGRDRTCRIIVRALQEYGMIAIDNGGHPKIYPEANHTANWGTLLTDRTPSKIPYSAFKVLDFFQRTMTRAQ